MKILSNIKCWQKIVAGIALLFAIFLAILPGIARSYIVKNSPELIGRQVHLEGLKINYFRVSLTLDGFAMLEADQQDTFVSFKEFYVNLNPWKLLKSEYAFSEVTLTEPQVSLIYLDSLFNFSDLIPGEDTTDVDTTSSLVKYMVRNITLAGGSIRYEDRTTGNHTTVSNLSVKVPEISWNSDQSDVGVSFKLGEDGEVTLGAKVNTGAEKYAATIKTKNIDITPFEGFAKPYLDISKLAGKLSTDILLSGSMSNPMEMAIKGDINLSGLMIRDMDSNEFLAADSAFVTLDSVDLWREQYHIGLVEFHNPMIHYVMEPGTTNLDRILAPYYGEEEDSTAVAAEEDTDSLSVKASQMHYSVRKFVLHNAGVNFTDLTLNRPFNYLVSEINMTMTGFSDLARSVPVSFSMLLDQAGSFAGDLVLDMIEVDNVAFNGILQNLNMMSFSPYSEYWIARPVTRGAMNYRGTLKMSPTRLDNKNHVRLVNMETGRKTKDTTAYKVPVGIALYVMKDRRGIIDFDLPVSGNPSSPTFKLKKIILKTLEEFLIKAAAAPLNAMGGALGFKPEEIREIPFGLLQDSLGEEQINKLDKLVEVMEAKPELLFTFEQTNNPDVVPALLACNETRIRYVRTLVPAGSAEAIVRYMADTLSFEHPGYLKFIGMESAGSEEEVIQRARIFIGIEASAGLMMALMQKRQKLLADYLAMKGIPSSSVVFRMTNLKNLPDDLKFPKFVVEVTLP
jgi:hypothetical protein